MACRGGAAACSPPRGSVRHAAAVARAGAGDCGGGTHQGERLSMQSGWSAGLRGTSTRRRKVAGLKGLAFRRRTPRRRLPDAARRDRQTGGGPAARAGATGHAPRGAPLDGAMREGGTPPGNEASEGGGAKGPCALSPHAPTAAPSGRGEDPSAAAASPTAKVVGFAPKGMLAMIFWRFSLLTRAPSGTLPPLRRLNSLCSLRENAS